MVLGSWKHFSQLIMFKMFITQRKVDNCTVSLQLLGNVKSGTIFMSVKYWNCVLLVGLYKLEHPGTSQVTSPGQGLVIVPNKHNDVFQRFNFPVLCHLYQDLNKGNPNAAIIIVMMPLWILINDTE